MMRDFILRLTKAELDLLRSAVFTTEPGVSGKDAATTARLRVLVKRSLRVKLAKASREA